MPKEIALADIVVDCPDEKKLHAFYGQLLGWKSSELFGHPALVSGNGVMLLFVQVEGYTAPVWPEEPLKQQKQCHFDFIVEDVAAEVARAQHLGAVKAPDQFGGENFTTMFDPAGHPFCLCAKN